MDERVVTHFTPVDERLCGLASLSALGNDNCPGIIIKWNGRNDVQIIFVWGNRINGCNSLGDNKYLSTSSWLHKQLIPHQRPMKMLRDYCGPLNKSFNLSGILPALNVRVGFKLYLLFISKGHLVLIILTSTSSPTQGICKLGDKARMGRRQEAARSSFFGVLLPEMTDYLSSAGFGSLQHQQPLLAFSLNHSFIHLVLPGCPLSVCLRNG